MKSATRARVIAYWACTLFVTLTALTSGICDMLHVQPLFGILLHLGYPPYFATVLGCWKVSGAVVLLAPRSPLLKEWAYAGMFCDYASAVASHVAAGDAAAALVGPALSIGLLAASWYLRAPGRGLERALVAARSV